MTLRAPCTQTRPVQGIARRQEPPGSTNVVQFVLASLRCGVIGSVRWDHYIRENSRSQLTPLIHGPV